MSASIFIRPARRSDAAAMAILVDIAGHGFAAWLWSAAVRRGEATSALEVGRARAQREEGGFSWINTEIAEMDGEVAGMLTGYRQPDSVDPATVEAADSIILPLVQLEALAPATWYINVLATFPEFRSRGVGAALVARASEIASGCGARGLSLIVEDANEGGRRFYHREGFADVATRPFRAYPGSRPGKAWILMTRPL